MANFSDIFKKSFLEGFTGGDISTGRIAATLAVTALIALYIFVIYRVVTRKTFYSKTFNISLVALAVVTSAIILAMQSNLVISLGMVGALSIIRFRTAIKDPMDLAFLFWSIAVGIICGVGLAEIAILLSVILTIGIFLLNHLPVAKAPMILVVNADDLNVEEKIMEVVRCYAKHPIVKSRNMSPKKMDLVIELRTDSGSEMLRRIMETQGVTSASLMTHDGEVTF